MTQDLDRDRPARAATPRPLVLAFFAAAIAALLGMIGLADVLRHDHPAAGPLTPEVAAEFDPLRDDVVCELEGGREGEDREQAAAEPALPTEITSNELYDCPQSWDGRRVLYTGEVIGAMLWRDDEVWTQLNDDVYGDAGAPLPTHRDFRGGNAGVGVVLAPQDAQQVTSVGTHARHGDVLEIVGTFVRVDADTGEVAIIRADQVRVVRVGQALEIPPSPGRAPVAGIAALAAMGVTIWERRTRSRR